MSMLRGISVQLLQKTQTALDDDGRPVYSWKASEIENVLVAPLIENSPQEALNQIGHRAVYHLAIPKTDGHRWEGQLVQFFGSTWSVIGIPTMGIDDLIPGPWNKKVVVELYHSEAPDVKSLWADLVALISESAVEDEDGYRSSVTRAERTVSCIFTAGIIEEDTADSQKAGTRRSATVEIWENDYNEEKLLKHKGTSYSVRRAKPSGRGTVLLELLEVWR